MIPFDDVIMFSCEIVQMYMPQDQIDDITRIDSGNGLVPSDDKQLPELMLAMFYDAIWRH